MQIIDIVILLVFAASVYYGYTKGIISQIGALAGLVCGIIMCRILGGTASTMFLSLLGHKDSVDPTELYTAEVLGNLLVFMLVYTIVRILAQGLRKVTDFMFLKPVDKIAGSLFAVVEWFVALSLLLNLWMAFKPESTLLDNSGLAGGKALETILDLAPWLFGSLQLPLN